MQSPRQGDGDDIGPGVAKGVGQGVVGDGEQQAAPYGGQFRV